MKKNLKVWLIIGILFISIFGSLSHFIYEWSGYNKIVGLFVSVNESTWEHIKLAIFSSLILMIIEYPFIGKKNNFFIGSFFSISIMILLIPTLFYGYQLFVENSLILDVLVFIISVTVGQFVFYKIMNSPDLTNNCKKISFVGLAIIIILYFTFTYFPPKCIWFKDPITNTYGINSNIKYINFNEEVTLKKGDTAKVKNKNVSITVTGFIYSPCPKGVKCIWSGLKVLYDIYVDGKKINEYQSKYKVNIIKTDYKTYAKILIVEPK